MSVAEVDKEERMPERGGPSVMVVVGGRRPSAEAGGRRGGAGASSTTAQTHRDGSWQAPSTTRDKGLSRLPSSRITLQIEADTEKNQRTRIPCGVADHTANNDATYTHVLSYHHKLNDSADCPSHGMVHRIRTVSTFVSLTAQSCTTHERPVLSSCSTATRLCVLSPILQHHMTSGTRRLCALRNLPLSLARNPSG